MEEKEIIWSPTTEEVPTPHQEKASSCRVTSVDFALSHGPRAKAQNSHSQGFCHSPLHPCPGSEEGPQGLRAELRSGQPALR